VQEGCSQAVGKPKTALLVTTQRSQCQHLQRVTHNKAKECLPTGTLLLTLKGPKDKRTKQEETETEKIHKHVKDM
jgi:hypothetical protein